MRAPRGVGAANGAVSRGTPPARIARNGPAATQLWRTRRTHPRWGEARDRVRGRRRAPSQPDRSPATAVAAVAVAVSVVLGVGGSLERRTRAPIPGRRPRTGQGRLCRSDAAGAGRHSTRIVTGSAQHCGTSPRSRATGRRLPTMRQDAAPQRRDGMPARDGTTDRRPGTAAGKFLAARRSEPAGRCASVRRRNPEVAARGARDAHRPHGARTRRQDGDGPGPAGDDRGHDGLARRDMRPPLRRGRRVGVCATRGVVATGRHRDGTGRITGAGCRATTRRPVRAPRVTAWRRPTRPAAERASVPAPRPPEAPGPQRSGTVGRRTCTDEPRCFTGNPRATTGASGTGPGVAEAGLTHPDGETRMGATAEESA